MNRWITKQQILDLFRDKNFESEDEFRDFLAPQLSKLFGVKNDQIDTEADTTSFDKTLSNRVDIVIRTDDRFRKAILVIELKLTKSVEKYKDGEYEEAVKQLHKYSQDTRAPYGILLTEISCAIFKNKYFSYNQTPKRVSTDKLPVIDKIEDQMAIYALLDFLLYKKSMKYFLIIAFFITTLVIIFNAFSKVYGVTATTISFLIIETIAIVIGAILLIVFKVFD